jgi:hypothetical protein
VPGSFVDLFFIMGIGRVRSKTMSKFEEGLLRSYWDAANCVGGGFSEEEGGGSMIAQNLLSCLRATAQKAGLPLADSVAHRICTRCSALLIPAWFTHHI